MGQKFESAIAQWFSAQVPCELKSGHWPGLQPSEALSRVGWFTFPMAHSHTSAAGRKLLIPLTVGSRPWSLASGSFHRSTGVSSQLGSWLLLEQAIQNRTRWNLTSLKIYAIISTVSYSYLRYLNSVWEETIRRMVEVSVAHLRGWLP